MNINNKVQPTNAVNNDLFFNRKQRRRMTKLNKISWKEMPKISKEENDSFIKSIPTLDEINYRSIMEMKERLFLDRKAKRKIEELQAKEEQTKEEV